MDITSAMLCDFAQVREGLLFISSGGITRIGCPPERPASFQSFLAIVIELTQDEARLAHEVKVKVRNSTTAFECGGVTLAFQMAGAALNPGENLFVPIALSLHPIAVGENGPYDVHISVDSGDPRILTAYVISGPPLPAQS